MADNSVTDGSQNEPLPSVSPVSTPAPQWMASIAPYVSSPNPHLHLPFTSRSSKTMLSTTYNQSGRPRFARSRRTKPPALVNKRSLARFVRRCNPTEPNRKDGYTMDVIGVVGSYGQMVWLLSTPKEGKKMSAMTTAEGSVLAARLGKTVATGLRISEQAMGRQGAPMTAFFDELTLQHSKSSRVCQHIGGIANVCFLPPNEKPGAGMAGLYDFDTRLGNGYRIQLYEQSSLLHSSTTQDHWPRTPATTRRSKLSGSDATLSRNSSENNCQGHRGCILRLGPKELRRQA